MGRLILFLLIASLISCSAPTESPTTQTKSESKTYLNGKRQLEAMGYVNVNQKSYPFFCCSDSDSILFSEGFSAQTKSGETVEGCFCAGWMKGVTIRFQ